MFYHEHDYTSVSSSERSVHSLYAAQPVNTGSTILILLALHEMQAVTGGDTDGRAAEGLSFGAPGFFYPITERGGAACIPRLPSDRC
jgi:hypothetical protein